MTLRTVALVAALGLGVVLLRSLVNRNIGAKVRTTQLCLVPFAGFVTYLVQPAPPFFELGFSLLTVALLLWTVVLAFWWRTTAAARWTEPVKAGTLKRSSRIQLGLQVTGVLGASSYLALFEPAFAIANLAANVLWAVWWVGAVRRTLRSEGSIEIAASRAAVWEFAIDSSNLGRWRVEISDIRVEPPGPFRVGSRVSAVRTAPLVYPWKGKTELRMESLAVVTAVEPMSSFSMAQVDDPGATTFDVSDRGGRTTVKLVAVYGWSAPRAILGEALRRRQVKSINDAAVLQDLSRLKQLLEQP